MAVWRATEPEHLRANRQLRYATPAIRPAHWMQSQDMEICNPCPTTFLLPISPAAHSVRKQSHRWLLGGDRFDDLVICKCWLEPKVFRPAVI